MHEFLLGQDNILRDLPQGKSTVYEILGKFSFQEC